MPPTAHVSTTQAQSSIHGTTEKHIELTSQQKSIVRSLLGTWRVSHFQALTNLSTLSFLDAAARQMRHLSVLDCPQEKCWNTSSLSVNATRMRCTLGTALNTTRTCSSTGYPRSTLCVCGKLVELHLHSTKAGRAGRYVWYPAKCSHSPNDGGVQRTPVRKQR